MSADPEHPESDSGLLLVYENPLGLEKGATLTQQVTTPHKPQWKAEFRCQCGWRFVQTIDEGATVASCPKCGQLAYMKDKGWMEVAAAKETYDALLALTAKSKQQMVDAMAEGWEAVQPPAEREQPVKDDNLEQANEPPDALITLLCASCGDGYVQQVRPGESASWSCPKCTRAKQHATPPQWAAAASTPIPVPPTHGNTYTVRLWCKNCLAQWDEELPRGTLVQEREVLGGLAAHAEHCREKPCTGGQTLACAACGCERTVAKRDGPPWQYDKAARRQYL